MTQSHLEAEIEALTAQRNSAQRKVKFYHHKWKKLVQDQASKRALVEAMSKWLESQVEYKKQSRNDAFYGWGERSEDERLLGQQEAYEEAVRELKRLQGGR